MQFVTIRFLSEFWGSGGSSYESGVCIQCLSRQTHSTHGLVVSLYHWHRGSTKTTVLQQSVKLELQTCAVTSPCVTVVSCTADSAYSRIPSWTSNSIEPRCRQPRNCSTCRRRRCALTAAGFMSLGDFASAGIRELSAFSHMVERSNLLLTLAVPSKKS